MINRNKQVITETCQPATHDTTDKKERTVWSGLVWLPDIEVRWRSKVLVLPLINIHIVKRFPGDMRTTAPLCWSANVQLNLLLRGGFRWQKKIFFNWMFSYLTPVPVELSPWQLKFPQEIALTPSNDKPSKYLEMFTMSDNAHISTSGQRTCLWWDEMEWKLFHHTTWQSWRLRNSSSSPLIFSLSGQYQPGWARGAQLHFLIYS